MKKIKDALVASLVLIVALSAPLKTAFAAEGDSLPVIYITQVQITGGEGKTSEDFIELFNPGDSAINLNAMRLVKRSATGTADSSIKSWAEDTLIAPHSFYLWANSNFTAIAAAPDAVTTATLADNNGVALRLGANDTGTIIDALSWGASTNTFPIATTENPGAGMAIKRADPFAATGSYGIETSSPRNSTMTLESGDPSPYATPYSTPYATPGDPDPYATPYATPSDPDPDPYATPYSSPYATPAPAHKTTSDLVTITEILPNPSGTDTGNEAFELHSSDTETVDISGWIVTDLTTSPTSVDALTIAPETLIEPGAHLSITIPSELFSLNNTASDGLVLYFADQTEIKRAQYPSSTPENKSWQFVNDQWIWNTPSLGQANTAPEPDPDEDEEDDEEEPSQAPKLRVSEFMPNPFGMDTGREWIELENFGAKPLNVENFLIDTKKTGAVSSRQFVLPDETLVGGERLALLIPEDSISLSNTIGSIRLFGEQRHLLQQISYKSITEGKTSSLSNGHWFVSEPSPNLASPVLAVSPLSVSEILPFPSDDQTEFVELANSSSQSIDLADFAILINKRLVKIYSMSISANGLAVIESNDEIELHLANSGKITLLSPFSEVIATVSYTGGKAGKSFAMFSAGFAWTDTPTPGAVNVLTLPPAKPPKISPPKRPGPKTASEILGAVQNELFDRAPSAQSSYTSETVDTQPSKLPKINLRSLLFFGAASVSGAFAVWQMREKQL